MVAHSRAFSPGVVRSMDSSYAVLLLGLVLVLGGVVLLTRFTGKAPASVAPDSKKSEQQEGGEPDSKKRENSGDAPGHKPPSISAPSGELLRLNQDDDEEDSTKMARLEGDEPEDPARLVVHSPGADQDDGASQPSLMLVMGVARTDTGQRRANNEDSHSIHEEHGLFVIADGMGGHQGGEIASQLAVKVTSQCYLDQSFPGEPTPGLTPQADHLQRAVNAANSAIFAESQQNRDLRGMGTTIVAAHFTENKRRLCIAHVGDSRCYRLRDGVFKQLTSDHTLGNLIGARGSTGDLLTRALGQKPKIEVDIQIDATQPGDTYLLCSDGLSKMVPDDDIKAILESPAEIAEVARALVNAANERGGNDNITVVVVRTNPLG